MGRRRVRRTDASRAARGTRGNPAGSRGRSPPKPAERGRSPRALTRRRRARSRYRSRPGPQAPDERPSSPPASRVGRVAVEIDARGQLKRPFPRHRRDHAVLGAEAEFEREARRRQAQDRRRRARLRHARAITNSTDPGLTSAPSARRTVPVIGGPAFSGAVMPATAGAPPASSSGEGGISAGAPAIARSAPSGKIFERSGASTVSFASKGSTLRWQAPSANAATTKSARARRRPAWARTLAGRLLDRGLPRGASLAPQPRGGSRERS